jgi:ABC-type branched-subunit amino acid transport system ATPase component
VPSGGSNVPISSFNNANINAFVDTLRQLSGETVETLEDPTVFEGYQEQLSNVNNIEVTAYYNQKHEFIYEEDKFVYYLSSAEFDALTTDEAQRIKLATDLSKRSSGRVLYLLDEPTTGLHFDDVAKLMNLLLKLRDQGNTIIVIEHNIDVIRSADWIVDMGPSGGSGGGEVIAEGPIEKIKASKRSYTAKFL